MNKVYQHNNNTLRPNVPQGSDGTGASSNRVGPPNTVTTLTESNQHQQQTSNTINIEEFSKSINPWDEKYDYLMHDSHWLTSNWHPDCEKCNPKSAEDLINLNETFDLYKSALEESPMVSSRIPRIPVRLRHEQAYKHSQPTFADNTKYPVNF